MLTPDLPCAELVDLVTDYLDDALDPVTRNRFDAHLAECPGCVRYVDQVRTTVRLLGQLPTPELPSAAREKLLAAFRARQRPPPAAT